MVNGGCGAYLSLGTAFDPPTQVTSEWAFYPSRGPLAAKIEARTPWWKRPAWLWTSRFHAWPFSVEYLSALFDYNVAPFFQSFIEVRVERSRRRVVLILNGVHGPLQWRDLQTGGTVMPAGAMIDDPVEFVVPMDRE